MSYKIQQAKYLSNTQQISKNHSVADTLFNPHK